MTTGRVILHLDLDCFYCQVEQKRLGIPREVPAAVQQWDGLIAINYAARALGVTRHMRVLQAMQKCPELQCLHVQTLGGESGQEGLDGPVNSGSTHPNDRLLHKACLERYRKASAEIIAVIRNMIPQAILEKASIDEVFVDVTPLVERELMEREDSAVSEHAMIDAFAWGSIVEGGPLDTESELDRRLSVGASISCRVRGAIREKLDFTSSVGIAHNKLLAKVGSARNKPDQQTIVTSRGITALMEDLPLKKLRNFGGKLGAELQALGATTAGQVAALPFQQLQQHFGDRAPFISNAVRGLDDEPVKVRELTKSMLAYKSFEATSDLPALNRWLGILADELSERISTESQLNQRSPRLLVLGYRQRGSPAGKSKSIAMPRAPLPGPTPAMLQQAAFEVLQKCADAFPCNNLGLSATEFQELPGDEQGCITRFFQPKLNAEKPDNQVAGGVEGKGQAKRQNAPPKPLKPVKNTINSLFKKAGNQPQQEPEGSVPSRASSGTLKGKPGPAREPPETKSTAVSSLQASERSHDSRKDHRTDADCGSNEARDKDIAERLRTPPAAEQQSADAQSIHDGHTKGAARPGDSGHEGSVEKGEEALPQSPPKGNKNGKNQVEVGTPQRMAAGEAREAESRSIPSDDTDMLEGKGTAKDNFQNPKSCSKLEGEKAPAEGTLENGQRGSPGQSEGATGVGGHEKSAKDPASDQQSAQNGTDDCLEGIDMREQKRILHEIWVRNNLRNGERSPKKQARKPSSTLNTAAKQPRLTDMFSKRH